MDDRHSQAQSVLVKDLASALSVKMGLLCKNGISLNQPVFHVSLQSVGTQKKSAVVLWDTLSQGKMDTSEIINIMLHPPSKHI